MKKLLIGTSALVAAASFAGAAQAADPIKLSIGGYGAVMVGYASQDDDYTEATGTEVTGVDVKGDNEIHFKGSTTLDNGLTVSVKYELEAGGRSNSDIDDEYGIGVSGGFGTLYLASDDTALSAIAMGAPRVGGRLWNGGFSDSDLTDGVYVLKPTGTSAPSQSYIGTSGDAESISYISPAVMGFTFGTTYVPDVTDTSGDDADQPTGSDSAEGYGAGLMWNGEFSGVTIGVEGGYLWAETEATATSATAAVNGAREEWQAGANVGYAGFTFGGAYHDIKQDQKVLGNNFAGTGLRDELNGDAWELGVSYKTGPYGVSLDYFNSSMENTATTVDDDTMEIWGLSGEYAMGPGVKLVGGLAWVDYENGLAAGASQAQQDSNENSGFVVTTGLSLSF